MLVFKAKLTLKQQVLKQQAGSRSQIGSETEKFCVSGKKSKRKYSTTEQIYSRRLSRPGSNGCYGFFGLFGRVLKVVKAF